MDKDKDLEDIDEDLDDLDFGDLDDLDFGNPSDKKDEPPTRETVKTDFKKGALDGLKFKSVDVEKVTNVLTEEFSHLGNLLDTNVEVMGSLTQYTDELKKSIGPSIHQLKTATRKILPFTEKLMPKKFYKKLTDKLDASSEFTYKAATLEEQRNNQIAEQLSNVFNTQVELSEKAERTKLTTDYIRDKKDDVKHTQLGTSVNAIKNIASAQYSFYQTGIKKFMIKSLELKYKHLFVSKDTLEINTKMLTLLDKKLSDIAHNSSLPDIQKQQLTESFKIQLRERTFGKASESIGTKLQDYKKNILKNIKENIFQRAGDTISEAFSGLSDAIEGYVDMKEQEAEFGDNESSAHGGGSMLSTFIKGYALKFATKLGIQKAGEGGKTLNERIGYLQKTFPFKIQQKISELSEKEGLLGKIGEFLQDDIVPSLSSTSEVDNLVKEGGAEAVPWDMIDRKALIEIIPGHLSKIRQFTEMTATGKPAEAKVYDFYKETFVSEKQLRDETYSNLFGDKESKTSSLEKIISIITTGYLKNGGSQTIIKDNFKDIVRFTNALVKSNDILRPKDFLAYSKGESHDEKYIDKVFQGVTDKLALVEILVKAFFKDDKEDKSVVQDFDTQAILLMKDRGNYINDLNKLNKFGQKSTFSELLTQNKSLSEIEEYKEDLHKAYKKRFKDKYEEKVNTPEIQFEIRKKVLEFSRSKGVNQTLIDKILDDVDYDYLYNASKIAGPRSDDLIRSINNSNISDNPTDENRSKSIREKIKDNFDDLKVKVKDKFDELSDSEKLAILKNKAKDKFSEVGDKVKDKFDELSDSEKLAILKNKAKDKFSEVSDKIKGVKDLDGIKSPFLKKLLNRKQLSDRISDPPLKDVPHISEPGAYVQESKFEAHIPLNSPEGFFSKFGQTVEGAFSRVYNRIAEATNDTPTGVGNIKKPAKIMDPTIALIKGNTDIYVDGSVIPGSPLITKAQLNNNELVSYNGKPINNISEIDGPVLNKDGDTLISTEHLKKGLVDVRGKSLFKKSFLGSIVRGFGKYYIGVLKAELAVAKFGFKIIKSVTGKIIKTVFSMTPLYKQPAHVIINKIDKFLDDHRASELVFNTLSVDGTNDYTAGKLNFGELLTVMKRSNKDTYKEIYKLTITVFKKKSKKILPFATTAFNYTKDKVGNLKDKLLNKDTKKERKEKRTINREKRKQKREEKRTTRNRTGGKSWVSKIAKSTGITAVGVLAGKALYAGGAATLSATGTALSATASGIGTAGVFLASNPIGWAITAGLVIGAAGYGIYRYSRNSKREKSLLSIRMKAYKAPNTLSDEIQELENRTEKALEDGNKLSEKDLLTFANKFGFELTKDQMSYFTTWYQQNFLVAYTTFKELIKRGYNKEMSELDELDGKQIAAISNTYGKLMKSRGSLLIPTKKAYLATITTSTSNLSIVKKLTPKPETEAEKKVKAIVPKFDKLDTSILDNTNQGTKALFLWNTIGTMNEYSWLTIKSKQEKQCIIMRMNAYGIKPKALMVQVLDIEKEVIRLSESDGDITDDQSRKWAEAFGFKSPAGLIYFVTWLRKRFVPILLKFQFNLKKFNKDMDETRELKLSEVRVLYRLFNNTISGILLSYINFIPTSQGYLKYNLSKMIKAKSIKAKSIKDPIAKVKSTNTIIYKRSWDKSSKPKLGNLSAKYESSVEGSSAIGNDSVGGKSYGKYQIATKTGTFDAFLQWASTQPGGLAVVSALQEAGNPDSQTDNNVANAWKRLAKAGKIQKLEHGFIKDTHYQPALNGLSPGLRAIVIKSETLQQVLWSTAVQHGHQMAIKIFEHCYTPENFSIKSFINKVYNYRGKFFKSSTPEVRDSIIKRFVSEKDLAFNSIKDTKIDNINKVYTAPTPAPTIIKPIKGAIAKVDSESMMTSNLSIKTKGVNNNEIDQLDNTNIEMGQLNNTNTDQLTELQQMNLSMNKLIKVILKGNDGNEEKLDNLSKSINGEVVASATNNANARSKTDDYEDVYNVLDLSKKTNFAS